MVDRARLESVFTVKGDEGSNPSLSAIFQAPGKFRARQVLEKLLLRQVILIAGHGWDQVFPLQQALEIEVVE